MLIPATDNALLPQGHEALFASEIKKYDVIGADIARNLEHQDMVMSEVERDGKVRGTGLGLPGFDSTSSCPRWQE